MTPHSSMYGPLQRRYIENTMISQKSNQIRMMEQSCRLAATALSWAGTLVKPGVTTDEIDAAVHDYLLTREATPSTLNYHGFPKSCCISVNDVVCHGVPSSYKLQSGDLVNIDITCNKGGFHGDTSATFYVGKVNDEQRKLTECAHAAMMEGISILSPKKRTGDVGHAIENFVKKKNFYIVHEIGGHGIGENFHEDPFVPSWGKKNTGEFFTPWKCITVEPIISETNSPLVSHLIPNSDIEYFTTLDHCLSAQFEHTILITDKGHEVLTAW